MSPAGAARWRQAALVALMMVLLAGCHTEQEERPTTSPSDSQAASTSGTSGMGTPAAAASAPASTAPGGGPEASQEAANAGPAALPARDLPDGANISVFRAEITQARLGEVRHPAGHEVPGSPGIVVSVRLQNLSGSPVDAAYLSSPTALVDGEQIAGVGDAEDPVKAVFGTIGASEEQTVDFVFPSPNAPTRIAVHLADPVSPGTAVDLVHEVAGRS